jgi:hypothetical protein
MFLLQCMSPLLALSGHTKTDLYLSAFGAKRTCTVVWLRPPRSQMTQRQHSSYSAAIRPGAFARDAILRRTMSM